MAKTLQFRRYNAAVIAVTTGASGELIVNTDANTITVHDGVTAGGWATTPIAYAQAAFATANGSTGYQVGINLAQNTGITLASANTIFLTGIENSQNANIVAVQVLANTDYTTLTASAGVYGNSTTVPVITLSANGRVSSVVNTAILIGYATGSGGVVIQSSSRTTGVTLNKPSGLITLFSTTMANTTSNTFVLTNSTIAANDFILLNHFSGGTLGNYTFASNTSAGQANVTIRSVATVAAEAPVIQFVVIKGAAT
jgi:hypothetical protein